MSRPCIPQQPLRQVREVAVAQYKLEHWGWATKRERAQPLREAIMHAWHLHQAGKPNECVRRSVLTRHHDASSYCTQFSEGDDECALQRFLAVAEDPGPEPQPPVDDCEEVQPTSSAACTPCTQRYMSQMDRQWSRVLEFQARQGTLGRRALLATQRLDADRQRLMLQGGAMHFDLWRTRYMGCEGDAAEGMGAFGRNAHLWGAEGSSEAVVEEWLRHLEATDKAYITLTPQVGLGRRCHVEALMMCAHSYTHTVMPSTDARRHSPGCGASPQGSR